MHHLTFAALPFGDGLRPIKSVTKIFSYVRAQRKYLNATFCTAHEKSYCTITPLNSSRFSCWNPVYNGNLEEADNSIAIVYMVFNVICLEFGVQKSRVDRLFKK